MSMEINNVNPNYASYVKGSNIVSSKAQQLCQVILYINDRIL